MDEIKINFENYTNSCEISDEQKKFCKIAIDTFIKRLGNLIVANYNPKQNKFTEIFTELCKSWVQNDINEKSVKNCKDMLAFGNENTVGLQNQNTGQTEPDSAEKTQEVTELQNQITNLLTTQIGAQTLQEKLMETQKDANKMTKLFVEFDKNRKCGSEYFDGLVNVFTTFQENTNTINTDLNTQDLEFLLNYFQKE